MHVDPLVLSLFFPPIIGLLCKLAQHKDQPDILGCSANLALVWYNSHSVLQAEEESEFGVRSPVIQTEIA